MKKIILIILLSFSSTFVNAQVVNRENVDLIAVTTINRDTLYFASNEPVCLSIKQVWDMVCDSTDKKPIIVFVNKAQLVLISKRTQSTTASHKRKRTTN